MTNGEFVIAFGQFTALNGFYESADGFFKSTNGFFESYKEIFESLKDFVESFKDIFGPFNEIFGPCKEFFESFKFADLGVVVPDYTRNRAIFSAGRAYCSHVYTATARRGGKVYTHFLPIVCS